MTRKLDFIVFGMARGGTSATARYLSAIEGVHCGQEVLAPNADHSTLSMPDALLTPSDVRRNDSSVVALEGRQDEISIWGNKTPSYFYRLAGVLDELDGVPSIACLRDPEKVAKSYSTRASTTRDPWHEGRYGIFAFGDALMLAHVLAQVARPERVLLMPQQALLRAPRVATLKAMRLIAPQARHVFREEAMAEIAAIKSRQASRKKVDLVGKEKVAANKLRDAGLSAFFERPEAVRLSEVQHELRDILSKCPPYPVAFIKRLAAEHPEPKARAYVDRWSAHAARTWAQLKVNA